MSLLNIASPWLDKLWCGRLRRRRTDQFHMWLGLLLTNSCILGINILKERPNPSIVPTRRTFAHGHGPPAPRVRRLLVGAQVQDAAGREEDTFFQKGGCPSKEGG